MQVKLTKLRMNPAGAKAILNDPAVKADLRRRADAVASGLDGVWSVDESRTDRVGFVVRPADKTARQLALETPGKVVGGLGRGRA